MTSDWWTFDFPLLVDGQQLLEKSADLVCTVDEMDLDNPVAPLPAGLGTCAVPITASIIFVDEASTIATAYAVAGYATDATHVSSSGSTLAVTGLANAFAPVANLKTLGTGQALATTPAGNAFMPVRGRADRRALSEI